MTNLEMQKRLNTIIDGFRAKYHVPSIMVSVHKDGETFFCGGGTANVEKNLPADENTIYPICSVSKSFIATALCILCDEGKLELDKPVKTYLPDFKMYDAYMTEHLTVRDAMGHRSGLPRHDVTWNNDEGLTIYDIVHRIRYLPPSFEPRARMHYQNHMFTLATVLCEKLSGMKWNEFITERILKPLGMTRTFCFAADYLGKDGNYAEPYRWDGALELMKFNDISHLGSCGCICSTVHDLDCWARLHLGRGMFEGKRIYSEKMADQMHNPQMIIKPGQMDPFVIEEVDFTSYGQAWFIEAYRGIKFVHHGGTIDGYKTLVGFVPKHGVAFSILTNLNRCHNLSPAALGYYIIDLALGLSEIDWTERFYGYFMDIRSQSDAQGAQMEEIVKNAPPQSHKNEEYVGFYHHPAYGGLTIYEKDGQLYTHFVRNDIPLLCGGHDLFFADGRKIGLGRGIITLRFDYDMTGKIVSVSSPLEVMSAPIVFEKQ